jgi:hypothetical protein
MTLDILSPTEALTMETAPWGNGYECYCTIGDAEQQAGTWGGNGQWTGFPNASHYRTTRIACTRSVMKLDPNVTPIKVNSAKFDPTESTFIPFKDASKCVCGRWELKNRQYCRHCGRLRVTNGK